MIRITCYLSLTVEVESGTDRQGWTRPLLNLTPWVARFYSTKARLKQASEVAGNLVAEAAGNLATACTVTSIGLSAIRFATIGG
jgi:hypothetical protein